MTRRVITTLIYVTLIAGMALGLSGVALAANGKVIDRTDKWAWGTNTGWINFAPTHGGAKIFPDHLEGYVWAENVGWIRLGSYTGEESHTYGNTLPTDYGVNHDGAGQLSGYAWSTNAGWINFAPTHGGVTIDLDTGSFEGHAWGENTGWISFKGTGEVAYNVVATSGYRTYLPAIMKP